MNAQADWWLLILGLGIGAGLTWLVLAEIRRHDDDVAASERAVEAGWIADSLTASGTEADAAVSKRCCASIACISRVCHSTSRPGIPAAPAWAPAPALTSEPATAPSAGDATPMERDRAEGQPAE